MVSYALEIGVVQFKSVVFPNLMGRMLVKGLKVLDLVFYAVILLSYNGGGGMCPRLRTFVKGRVVFSSGGFGAINGGTFGSRFLLVSCISSNGYAPYDLRGVRCVGAGGHQLLSARAKILVIIRRGSAFAIGRIFERVRIDCPVFFSSLKYFGGRGNVFSGPLCRSFIVSHSGGMM